MKINFVVLFFTMVSCINLDAAADVKTGQNDTATVYDFSENSFCYPRSCYKIGAFPSDSDVSPYVFYISHASKNKRKENKEERPVAYVHNSCRLFPNGIVVAALASHDESLMPNIKNFLECKEIPELFNVLNKSFDGSDSKKDELSKEAQNGIKGYLNKYFSSLKKKDGKSYDLQKELPFWGKLYAIACQQGKEVTFEFDLSFEDKKPQYYGKEEGNPTIHFLSLGLEPFSEEESDSLLEDIPENGISGVMNNLLQNRIKMEKGCYPEYNTVSLVGIDIEQLRKHF